MPFPYRYIGDLLQQLDDDVRKSPEKQVSSNAIIESWFQQHRPLLDEPDNDGCAIISTLLPDRRTDRVYNIQAPRLQNIFAKALRLGPSRVSELRRWSEPGSGMDLADCIESVLRRTPNSRDDTTHLTVEDIDEKLNQVAAACKFSSPAIRALRKMSDQCGMHSLLTSIYTKLGSRDAKWFTRLILKNYQPVVLKRYLVFRNYHPLLPQILQIRDDLSIATECIRRMGESTGGLDTIADFFKPCLGTKVGRQPWFKGRSIKNCLNMAQRRDISCEQKIDGEYCQIHVDLSKPQSNCIQIFSKSGKDSTADRINLHKVILDSLRIGNKDCSFTKGCILEGELVVYSTKERRILPFHTIRKHVSRSGSFLGTGNDSPAHESEHLMIVYYDMLLIDEQSLLGMKNSERFQLLSRIVTSQQGYAELVSRTTICTAEPSAAADLRELFAQCLSSRSEGLVLKPDEPYIDFNSQHGYYGCCNIKLKKEYIQGWGDVGDFAVIGATYDTAKAREYNIPNLRWTHFFIGCLENNDQARAKTEAPLFRVTNIVELTGPVLSTFWEQGNPVSVPYEDNTSIQLNLNGSVLAKKPTVIFPSPLVFDMRCFSFDKEPNTNFWCMRFPQVSKVHHDRSYLDTISFSELQEIAEEAKRVPAEEDSQEMRQWLKALEGMDREGPSQTTTCSDGHLSSAPSTSSHTARQRVHDKSTLAIPSADGVIAVPEEIRHTSTTVTASNPAKRSPPEDSGSTQSPKRYQRLSGISSMDSSPNMPQSATTTRTCHREPLGLVDTNTLETRLTGSEHSSSALPVSVPSVHDEADAPSKKTSSSLPAAYDSASEIGPPLPKENAKIGPNPAMSTTDQTRTDDAIHSCSVAGDECTLASCSILLSPCIAGYALVTEDLLGRHGIVEKFLDPRAWDARPSDRSMCDSTAESSKNPSTPQTTAESKRQVRKICLVESKRKQATEAFLRTIKEADIRRKDGKREWVTVYDWRVLESITEHELKASSSTRGVDPWRRFYMGIV
ncbi:hypothetical protein GGS21DRAFT_494976 [Xylaria nigripes]|nr:hypothetical protein GGS21DRAFT_494976 [Xylaria nigripes]